MTVGLQDLVAGPAEARSRVRRQRDTVAAGALARAEPPARVTMRVRLVRVAMADRALEERADKPAQVAAVPIAAVGIVAVPAAAVPTAAVWPELPQAEAEGWVALAPVKGMRLAMPPAPRQANHRSHIHARTRRLPAQAACLTLQGRRWRATAAPSDMHRA